MIKRNPISQMAKIVRYNGHTFELQKFNRDNGNLYKHLRQRRLVEGGAGGLLVLRYGSFLCKVCGLRAIAEKSDGPCNYWKEWYGAGQEIHCGVEMARIVHES